VGYTGPMRRSIQALLLLRAALWPCAAVGADRLLVGGVVHLPNGSKPLTIAIEGGRISALLPPGEEGGQRGDRTEVVDLGGAHVLPGWIDSHLHLTGYGASLEQVDLTGASSWEVVVERALAAAARLPADAWLEGRGWDQNLWADPILPDHRLLDRRLPGRPVLLRRVDGHAAVASGAALRLAGIDRDAGDPPGGRIGRRADGEPSGLLLDTAVELVRGVMPPPSREDVERRILRAAQALLDYGLTQVHDAGTGSLELEVLRRLAAERRLPIRVYALLDGDDPGLVERELARGPDRQMWAMLRVGGVKLYADGALGSRGALLGADYADDPGNRGIEVRSVAELGRIARRASESGFQLAVHAIGDEAVHRTLNVFEGLGPHVCRRLRHRVEHSQVVRASDALRFSRLGVVASVQPTHCTSDMPWAPQRLGARRISWAYRWRSLLDAEALLAGGSDAPVEDPDPRRGLHAAVTRQRPDGTPREGWTPSERLTIAEALRLFTLDGAHASFSDGWCGVIRRGNAADLTVVDVNPLEVDPERLLHLKVLRTIVAGVDRHLARAADDPGESR